MLVGLGIDAELGQDALDLGAKAAIRWTPGNSGLADREPRRVLSSRWTGVGSGELAGRNWAIHSPRMRSKRATSSRRRICERVTAVGAVIGPELALVLGFRHHRTPPP